jgi:hypothetical protein
MTTSTNEPDEVKINNEPEDSGVVDVDKEPDVAGVAKEPEVNSDEPQKGGRANERIRELIDINKQERLERQRLADRLSELERNQQAIAQGNQEQRINQLEEQIESAEEDGDKAKARALRKERDGLYKQSILHETKNAIAEQLHRQEITARVNNAVDYVNKTYPELDPESDKYDPDKLEFAVYKRDQFIKNGMNADEAIKKSAKLVCGKNDAILNTSDKRTESAIKRGMAASSAQVDAGKGSAAPITQLDVAKMSDEEFAKLTADQKAALRGDKLKA